MTIFIPKESSKIVANTFRKEIDRLKKRIEKLSKNLRKFEEQYQMSSEEFVTKFKSGEIAANEVFSEWYADAETLKKITKKLELLEKVKLFSYK